MADLKSVRSDVRATICIPTVHRLGFFQEALESAASQTFQDYEIVISVNSPRASYFQEVATAVEEVGREFPSRAIRIIQPTNFLNIADHLNFMVEHAGGDYWCYLADDDRMEPEFLESLVSLLKTHGDAGFAFCDFEVIDGTGAIRPDLARKLTRSTNRDMLVDGFYPHPTLGRLALWNAIWFPCALFKRPVLESFPFDPGNQAPDRDFWLRIANAPSGFGAVYTSTPLLEYRLHGDQHSKASAKAQLDFLGSLGRAHSIAAAEPRVFKLEVAHIQAKLGKALLDEGDRLGAYRALLVALRNNPFDTRTYRFALQSVLPTFVLRFARRFRDWLQVRRSRFDGRQGRPS